MRVWSAIASSIIALGALAACGNSTEAYCDHLEEMTEMSDTDDEDQAISLMEDIRDESPGDVEDDWDVVVEWTKSVQKSMEGDEDAMDGMDEDEVQDAFENTEQSAQDECDIDLDDD